MRAISWRGQVINVERGPGVVVIQVRDAREVRNVLLRASDAERLSLGLANAVDELRAHPLFDGMDEDEK